MSQIPPEPAEPSEIPAEPAEPGGDSPESAVPPPPPLSEAAATPDPASAPPVEPAPSPQPEAAAVPPPPPPPDESAVPATPDEAPPMTPQPAPVATPPQPGMVSPAAPAPRGPDWFSLSQKWLDRSQEITAQVLYDTGGWIFSGLLLATLLLFQPLIGLGFADGATLLAGLAFALALPFNLAGLGTIYYFRARTRVAEAAGQELGQNPNLDAATLVRLTEEKNGLLPERRALLDSSLSLALYLSAFFTLLGTFFALWHISWAVALLFLLACVGGLILLLRAIRS